MLEHHLVLNRYLHSLLGAEELEKLKPQLQDQEEGPAADGQSHFFRVLLGRRSRVLPEDSLREYDTRLLDYERRLADRRRDFRAFKYFQYLCLLYTEILLDHVTADPEALRAELNQHLRGLQARGAGSGFREFTLDDLRRLAFFLATGAGKTLLLHANLWQVQHYLEHGRHPEALVRRPDARAEFDGIYLITPNEGLSKQHLEEFHRSGIEARHLVHDPPAPPSLFGPMVHVVEIAKLAETVSGEGVSVPLEQLGANLVFVDEGHKGAGAEGRAWKTRQKRLSAHGMLLEYSATFAQAIGAASRRDRAALLEEYGKAIVFDYSYRHFYNDEHGKDFSVLNLQSVRESEAHDLLVGGLLLFHQQRHVYRRGRERLRDYGVEPPLWVFLGSKVNAVYTRDGRSRSDVAIAVGFLRRFLEEREWAIERIGKVLRGASGFRDPARHADAFAPRLTHLQGNPARLYDEVCREVFNGRGALEVWEIKRADGELALRTSTPQGGASPYFGVINIGDVSSFKRHLSESVGLDVQDDHLSESLFGDVDRRDSPITLLIGAKKFVEGWSSWRVSTMGLLNMAQGEGPQVIQLFGRGVRLRGRDQSLKRSVAGVEPADPSAPEGLRELETLQIFGWNADYIQAFRAMLNREDLHERVEVPVLPLWESVSELPIPSQRAGYRATAETWTLQPESDLAIQVDLSSRLTALAGGEVRRLEAGEVITIGFGDGYADGLVNHDRLYAGLLAHKKLRGHTNVVIRREMIPRLLQHGVLVLNATSKGDPELIQSGAMQLLTRYLDRFVARREREAQGRELVPGTLKVSEHRPLTYQATVASERLARELKDLISESERLTEDGGAPLPRLHFDRHLWTPLLLEGGDTALHTSPVPLKPSEEKFLKDLRDFWSANHSKPAFAGRELYVMRNMPGRGVGFFERSGFFPDFIVWLTSPDGSTRVRFVEPHGMHHGGLERDADKIEAFQRLGRLSQQPAFNRAKLDVAGWIVTETPLADIRGAAGMGWEQLQERRVLRQAGEYVGTVLLR